MNPVKTSLAIAAILCASTFAFAHDGKDQDTGHQTGHHHGGGHHGGMMNSRMKAMDTDNDGLVSKAEFMKAHEAMWDSMPKDKSGQVSLAEMEKAHQARMAERHEQRREKMMQQHENMMQEHEEMMDETETATKDETAKEDPAKQ
jgi:hypothetical protein